MRRGFVAIVAAFAVSVCLAIDTEKAFDDPERQARYETLIDEVRCLVCQNQTIKDSNAFLASDLRREIRRMIEEGMSDDEIASFLVNRYGDFVLYRPPMRGHTLMLWIAPALLLAGGLAVVLRIVRGRSGLPVDEDPEQATG